MTEEAKQSFIDIVRQFALDLGLPTIDVDKLVAAHKKNFEALTQTAQIAADGVKAVAAKQKETIEFGVSRSRRNGAFDQACRRSEGNARPADSGGQSRSRRRGGQHEGRR